MKEPEKGASPAIPPRATPSTRDSLGSLLRRLVQDILDLVRAEIRLAEGEIRDNLAGAFGSFASIALGLILISVATMCLLGATVAFLALFVGIVWSALIVAGVTLVLGGGLVWNGIARLRVTTLLPRRTAENIKRDMESLKGD